MCTKRVGITIMQTYDGCYQRYAVKLGNLPMNGINAVDDITSEFDIGLYFATVEKFMPAKSGQAAIHNQGKLFRFLPQIILCSLLERH